MHFLRDAIEHISIKLAALSHLLYENSTILILCWHWIGAFSVQRSTTKIILTNHCAAPSASSVEWINHWFICTYLDTFLTFCYETKPKKYKRTPDHQKLLVNREVWVKWSKALTPRHGRFFFPDAIEADSGNVHRKSVPYLLQRHSHITLIEIWN